MRDIFLDEPAARRHLEALRWPDGVRCPHCRRRDGVCRLRGRSADAGLYFCTPCRRKFTVRIGTPLERSHIPLHKWLLAVHLAVSTDQRFSVNLLSRLVGIQYRSAASMALRIRHAAAAPPSPPERGKNRPTAVASRQAAEDAKRDDILRCLLRMSDGPQIAPLAGGEPALAR